MEPIQLLPLQTANYSVVRTSLPYVDTDLEIRSYLYAAFGAITCISSTICILVLSTRDLRERYILFLALSLGDLLNGLSFVAAGVFRNLFMYHGSYYIHVTSAQCLLQTPWAVPMLFAGQFPALMNLFIALERVLALEFAEWYHNNWRPHHKLYLIFAAFMMTFMFFMFAVIINHTSTTLYTSRLCTVLNSTGIIYGTAHYALISLTYIFCFIVLMTIFDRVNRLRIAFLNGLRLSVCSKQTPSKEEEGRQKMKLALTGLSVLLVSIPCIFMVMDEYGVPGINELITGIAYCLYAVHSVLSLVVYVVLRPDFRAQLVSLAGMQSFIRAEKLMKRRLATHSEGDKSYFSFNSQSSHTDHQWISHSQ
ncbi:unnamed protein product [Cylicocyclus nassatus]|uniref:G-protein coupled receptors family 1 profile domain-containing protein n=1 Tax=Cylicocyclus nassatus TaxID=53992 RepID=A0AA36H2N3_CYLNA|nr:unnamed protein product [Cylicocyclus nassatus]